MRRERLVTTNLSARGVKRTSKWRVCARCRTCGSQTVRDLVAGSGLPLEDRGAHVLKGVPNEWRLFRAALSSYRRELIRIICFRRLPFERWGRCLKSTAPQPTRRECLDYLTILSKDHLRWILQTYTGYYNKIRTHRSLDEDDHAFRAVQRVGNVASHAMLGSPHHQEKLFLFSMH